MKLLFDENLSPRLISLLADSYPGSRHVAGCGLKGHDDTEVWRYAGERGFVLVSKDNDFSQLAILHGAPPKVVWLRVGNGPTDAARDLLAREHATIAGFCADAESSLLILGSPS